MPRLQGKHVLSFTVRLPDALPPSYSRSEGDESAEVLYYTKAKVGLSTDA